MVSEEEMKSVMQEAADFCGVEIGELSDGQATVNKNFHHFFLKLSKFTHT